jgi:hypothetical protein
MGLSPGKDVTAKDALAASTPASVQRLVHEAIEDGFHLGVVTTIG